MIEPVEKASQTCVIGCGGCGSQIAAYFDKIPSVLRHRTWHLYPIRCAAIDTAQGMENILMRSPWYWHEKEDIHIIPTASHDHVYQRITGIKKLDPSDSLLKSLQERWRSGAGQFPFIGTLTAEEYFIRDNPVRRDLEERFVKREFTQGGLLIVNSLTGGTGTGIAPLIPELFSFFHNSGIILNLSIIPQLSTRQQKAQFYPKSILYGLYQLSQNTRVDAVILADNETMSKQYNCKGIPQYNDLLHEIITPFLLASPGEYDYPNFNKHIDFADIYRILRPERGMAAAELCTLSYAKKKVPLSFLFTLVGKRKKADYINRWLHKLVDEALKKTTIGKIDMASVKSAVCILSGPPDFFEKFLEGNDQFYQNLVEYCNKYVSNNILVGNLQFPEAKTVQLSFILTGISSPKLDQIYGEVIPEKEQSANGTLMDKIRRLKPEVVEDLMIKEIREKLAIK